MRRFNAARIVSGNLYVYGANDPVNQVYPAGLSSNGAGGAPGGDGTGQEGASPGGPLPPSDDDQCGGSSSPSGNGPPGNDNGTPRPPPGNDNGYPDSPTQLACSVAAAGFYVTCVIKTGDTDKCEQLANLVYMACLGRG